MPRSVALKVLSLCCLLLLCSCSDDDKEVADAGLDATADLPPKSQWTPCPKTRFEAEGKTCVGANHCELGGSCSPGDSCGCKNGKWYCLHTDCGDRGVDMPLPDAKPPKPDSKVGDGSAKVDITPPPAGWGVPAGGSGAGVQGNGIAVDSAGNSLVTGHFKGQAAFGSTTLSSAAYDVFVAKVSPSGKFIWALKAGGSGSDYGYGIAADAKGGALVTGSFSGTATFGTLKLVGQAKSDAFVARLDAAGKWQWAVSLTGTGVNSGTAVTTDVTGNVLFCGAFNEKANIGFKTLTSTGKSEAFVAQLDAQGKIKWVVTAGGPSYDQCNGVAVNPGGDVLLAGSFWQTMTLGSVKLVSKGNADVFVAQLSSTDGKVKWVVSGGGLKNDHVHGLAADTKGNAHLAGTFIGPAVMGGSTLTGGSSANLFVARVTSSGSFSWAAAPGGSSPHFYDGVYHTIAAAPSGASLVTGAFTGSATFGKTAVTTKGMQEAFVVRVSDKGAFAGLALAKAAYSTGSTVGSGVALDAKGTAHVTGVFLDGPATFGKTSLTPKGKGDLFIWKTAVP